MLRTKGHSQALTQELTPDLSPILSLNLKLNQKETPPETKTRALLESSLSSLIIRGVSSVKGTTISKLNAQRVGLHY